MEKEEDIYTLATGKSLDVLGLDRDVPPERVKPHERRAGILLNPEQLREAIKDIKCKG